LLFFEACALSRHATGVYREDDNATRLYGGNGIVQRCLAATVIAISQKDPWLLGNLRTTTGNAS